MESVTQKLTQMEQVIREYESIRKRLDDETKELESTLAESMPYIWDHFTSKNQDGSWCISDKVIQSIKAVNGLVKLGLPALHPDSVDTTIKIRKAKNTDIFTFSKYLYSHDKMPPMFKYTFAYINESDNETPLGLISVVKNKFIKTGGNIPIIGEFRSLEFRNWEDQFIKAGFEDYVLTREDLDLRGPPHYRMKKTLDDCLIEVQGKLSYKAKGKYEFQFISYKSPLPPAQVLDGSIR